MTRLDPFGKPDPNWPATEAMQARAGINTTADDMVTWMRRHLADDAASRSVHTLAPVLWRPHDRLNQLVGVEATNSIGMGLGWIVTRQRVLLLPAAGAMTGFSMISQSDLPPSKAARMARLVGSTAVARALAVLVVSLPVTGALEARAEAPAEAPGGLAGAGGAGGYHSWSPPTHGGPSSGLQQLSGGGGGGGGGTNATGARYGGGGTGGSGKHGHGGGGGGGAGSPGFQQHGAAPSTLSGTLLGGPGGRGGDGGKGADGTVDVDPDGHDGGSGGGGGGGGHGAVIGGGSTIAADARIGGGRGGDGGGGADGGNGSIFVPLTGSDAVFSGAAGGGAGGGGGGGGGTGVTAFGQGTLQLQQRVQVSGGDGGNGGTGGRAGNVDTSGRRPDVKNVTSGGGGGGGGGSGAILDGVSIGLSEGSAVRGGNGGRGGDGGKPGNYTDKWGAGPGSGGDGGTGVSQGQGSVVAASNATITGGAGGAGGDSTTLYDGQSLANNGATGGLGGVAALIAEQGGLDNSGRISGGQGGSGGAALNDRDYGYTGGNPGVPGLAGGDGGSGADGGGAVVQSGGHLINRSGGSVVGGNGGSGGSGGHGGRGGQTDDSPGSGGVGGQGGRGGNAGNGGVGMVLTNTRFTNQGSITGGAGGPGGSGGTGGTGGSDGYPHKTNTHSGNGGQGGQGGRGGAGGAGVRLPSGTGADFLNDAQGSIKGGEGGAGGQGGEGGDVFYDSDKVTRATPGAAGKAGAGGDGGSGIVVNQSMTITNFGTLAGGNAGAGSGIAMGGSGLVAYGSGTVVNGGTIIGGMNGDGTRAPALVLKGTGSTLELRAGSTIVGDVLASSFDSVLVLGGTANASFDLAGWGSQYRGFSAFKKAGAGTWTLSNGATVIYTYVDDGTLVLSNGARLRNDNTGSIDGAAGSSATMIVDGAKTNWTLGGVLRVGDTRNGNLTVSNGGTVSAAWASVGVNAGSTGAITVTGNGASFDSGYLMLGDGGTGSALVSGAGASLTAPVFVVGRTGSGTLTVANGGKAGRAGAGLGKTIDVAANAGSAGTINIGAAAGQAAMAPGTLEGDVRFGAGTGALVFNHTAGDYSFNSPISGSGTISLLAGTTIFTADSSGFSGATSVSNATLQMTGTARLGGTVAVDAGGTVGGEGAIGATTVKSGGTLAPSGKTSLTVTGNLTAASGGTIRPSDAAALVVDGTLTLEAGSAYDYRIRGYGNSSPDSATTRVNGDLALNGGTLNLASSSSPAIGYHRLFSYTGNLSGSGLVTGTTPVTTPVGYAYSLDTSLTGKVDLLVAPNGLNILQLWGTTPGGGGSGTWNASNANWFDLGGAVPTQWGSGYGVFRGPGGTVTIDGQQSAVGLQFAGGSYTLVSGAGGSLNLHGFSGGGITITTPEIRVLDGETATIALTITGSAGLEKTGDGTLILSGTNSYSGGTVISGGTLQISADANLGAGSGGLILDNGALLTTAYRHEP